MDVWSDDVLKEVLRDARQRRSHRRRLRYAAIGAALVAGAALALLVARIAQEVPGVVSPAETALLPAAAPVAEIGPLAELLAQAQVPAPVAGATPILVDLLLSSLSSAQTLLVPPVLADAAEEVVAALEPEAPAPLLEDVIRPGDTVLGALARHGVAASTAAFIVRELRPHIDFRRARPGHRYRIERDEAGELVAFRYQVSDHEHYELLQQGERWETRGAKRGTIRQQARLAGVVATTLYDAIQDLGERPELAAEFAGIFAWDVDFARNVHAGAEFHLLYERNYVAREGGGRPRYIGPGKILAARYLSGGQTHEAIYYETSPGVGSYYRPDGSPVQQGFLAAPVKYTRISSSFTNARFHPILRRTRPHPGIDYAAPAGTPVWAVAGGRVSYVDWMGGYGRLVKIEHADGYESYYAHLSGFAKGLRVGQTVGQKQVIGYVGSSGLSTGPHVCFRITKNGTFVNPASTRIPSGDRIAGRQRQDFETIREARLAQLGPEVLVAVDEAM